MYGYYTELPQSRIVLAPKRLNSLKNVDLKANYLLHYFPYFYGIIIYYVKIIKKILWVEHQAGRGHIIGNNSMKLQHDDCFPDFANSESFFHLKQRLFQKHENFQ